MSKIYKRFSMFGIWLDITLLLLTSAVMIAGTAKDQWYRMETMKYWLDRFQGKDLLDSRGILFHGNRSLREIALTFDDGPDPVYTPKTLEALQKANMKATFFLVAEHVKQHPELVKQILDEGHQIGCHSYSHLNYTQLTYKQQWRDIRDSISVLHKFYPKLNYTLFRPPYGRWDDNTIKASLNHKMMMVLWTRGGDSLKPEEAAPHYIDKLLRHTENGAILLLHDHVDPNDTKQAHKATVERLNELLEKIKEKGWTSVTIEQLLDHLPSSAKGNFKLESLRK